MPHPSLITPERLKLPRSDLSLNRNPNLFLNLGLMRIKPELFLSTTKYTNHTKVRRSGACAAAIRFEFKPRHGFVFMLFSHVIPIRPALSCVLCISWLILLHRFG
jgi:hypothetical protein